MSDLYTVFPALTPSANDVLEAELLAKQVLEAKFPNIDLREGTGLRDLIIRPTAFALALLKKSTDVYFSSNTLDQVTDSTDEALVNSLLSNWFLDRHLGTYAIISSRLFFARAKNVTIPSSSYFSTDNTLKFFPGGSVTIQASDMVYDSYQNEWYVDVQLIAENQGSSYNIGEGSLLYFSTFDPYFLHAEINYLVSSATEAETNSEFISRAKTAISTRNAINVPSVDSLLRGSLNYLTRIFTVGSGDLEMIRDQVKAIIDPESPRKVSVLIWASGVATATLSAHGFEVGQVVNLTGSVPSDFSGQFTVTEVTPDTFKYAVPGTPGEPTSLPYVQSETAPCLIHTGGMADIYCGDDVSTGLTQVTLDSTGSATIVGPIYRLSRSEVSGGVEEDSIPNVTTLSVSSSTIGEGSIHVETTSPHSLSEGDVVNVTSLTQSQPITSIVCTNLVVTVSCLGHGLTTGNKVIVQGVTPVSYNGTYTVEVTSADTFTYALPINILTAGMGTMEIINPDLIGDFPIIFEGTSSFTISLPRMWGVGSISTSGMNITHKVPYTITLLNRSTLIPLSLTGVGRVATLTKVNHGLSKGRYIIISGATPTYYNGTWRISQVTNANQFTFEVSEDITSNASGTILCEYTTPWKDTGFSTKQELLVQFSPAYAEGTASFEVQYFTHVESVQEALLSQDNHILCADYLARGFNVCELDVHVNVYNGPAPSTALVKQALDAYLKTLVAGDTFILNDFGVALSTVGISNVQTPIMVNYTRFNRDWMTPTTGVITDYLDPSDTTSVFISRNVGSDSLSV